MNLRTQLKETAIKVVEIVPPSVGTDLHRERSDPHDNKKDKNPSALSVEEFMEYLVKGWKEDSETIGAGMGVKLVERWYGEFGGDYEGPAEKFKVGTL
jgi:short-subunit dehydrogenase involved in D-alanine esterification of teichoic acids